MKSVGNTTMDENPTNKMEKIEFGRQYKIGCGGRRIRHRLTTNILSPTASK
jgi:hypothetical protein